jgi:hypothetical protein
MARTAVHIFLDTNALFTEVANRLVAKEISDFILQSLDNDLNPSWYIPSVVIGERRFQMFERAKRLLPHLEKVEQLLGHQLGISDKVLAARVDDAIKQHMDTHKLIEIGFDHLAVDWQDMVRKSVERKPPFKQGDNEKGFRDAIVLETFCQRVSNLPRSPQICRIVLLSNDGLLVEAARERMGDRNNVTFANDLDAVRTILNALASQITQEAVSALLPMAENLFFTPENRRTLLDKIQSQYSNELRNVPKGWSSVAVKAVHILSPPTFIEKKGQKLTFSNRVVFHMEATKYVQSTIDYNRLLSALKGPSGLAVTPNVAHPFSGSTAREDLLGLWSASDVKGSSGTSSLAGLGMLGAMPPEQRQEVKCEGETVFEATWSAILTAKGKLTRAQLQKVDYKETNWEGTQVT